MASDKLPSKKVLKKLLASLKSVPAPSVAPGPVVKVPSNLRKGWNKFYEAISKLYGVIGVLVTLVSALIIKDLIYEWITPREKLWKEKTYINGIALDNKVIDDDQMITIILGGSSGRVGLAQQFPVSSLQDTIAFTPRSIETPGGGTPFDLRFLLKNNRLYVSTVFKDLDDKYVGKMDFTSWELKSNKISNYHDGDDNLEIMDEYNYVLFNMKYFYPNTVVIHGYHLTSTGIQIANDTSLMGFSKKTEDRDEVLRYIQGIKPLNKY